MDVIKKLTKFGIVLLKLIPKDRVKEAEELVDNTTKDVVSNAVDKATKNLNSNLTKLYEGVISERDNQAK